MTRERKYILIVGAVLLLFGVMYRFSSDLQGLQSLEEEIALKQKKLVKYRQIVRERNELEAKLISLNRTLERSESGLLSGETTALAAVDIQNILNDIAGRSGIEITRMRVLKPKESAEQTPGENHYMTIPVQITISATTRQLKEILYKIETSMKYLRVSDMRVRLTNVKQVEKIYSTITVEGFMKKSDQGTGMK